MLDSDVDLWVVDPSRQPIFYGSRQVGCADLDRDSLGFQTSLITLGDGSTVRSTSNKEVTSVRCFEPGHWDVGVNLYSDREIVKSGKDIKVHIEIVGLNPEIRTIFAKDAALDRVGETVNVVSFEMGRDGKITLANPALEPITTSTEVRSSGLFQCLRAFLWILARRYRAHSGMDIPYGHGTPGG
jgi:hypothetical protein